MRNSICKSMMDRMYIIAEIRDFARRAVRAEDIDALYTYQITNLFPTGTSPSRRMTAIALLQILPESGRSHTCTLGDRLHRGSRHQSGAESRPVP